MPIIKLHDLFLRGALKVGCATSLLAIGITSAASAIDSFSTYERAEFYHEHSQQQWNVAYEALKGYAFQGNEAVLEVGCRGGRGAANIAGRIPNGEVIATEMRGPGAIAFASQNHPKSLYPNLIFLEQDFFKTSYRERFDLVVSFSSLHWYADQQAILKKVHEALKPHGQILFTIPGKPLTDVNSVFAILMNKEEWKPFFENYSHPRKKFTPEEYMVFLVEAGFNPIDVKMKRCEYLFENKRALIDWFRAFSPILDCIPDSKKAEFLIDFANTYVGYFPIRPDGQIPFMQDELIIKAMK